MLVYAPDLDADPDASQPFVVYSDADHLGCEDTGRSTSGLVVKIGTGATSWASKLQGMVTLSSTEAEYIAACAAGQELLFTQNLFDGLHLERTPQTTLLVDNKSAIQVARNPEHHGRMKQLDAKYFWLREKVDNGRIEIEHVPTALNAADIMTKPLGRNKMAEARKMLGLFETFDHLPILGP
jgi:hypothetical protein